MAATDHDAPLVRVLDVHKVFHRGSERIDVLQGLRLDVPPGDFLALMGPSGSGKSTLLNVLGCLDTPTSGTYRLDGEPVQDLSEDRLAAVRQRRIGFVFQAYHLVGRMTAARNGELPMSVAGVEPEQRRARVAAALEAVGLAPRAHHRPDQLSGGERQRVAIARATVNEPSILLADEPTGNLDSRAGAEIVALLERLNAGGLTIVLVTHDPGVGAHAGRILHMRDGRILDDGPGYRDPDPDPDSAPPGARPGARAGARAWVRPEP